MAIANDGAHTGIVTDADLSDADRRRAKGLVLYLEQNAYGEQNAVRVTVLAAALGVSGRKVRTLVTHLRHTGRPILATPESGYFLPRSRAEADHTLAFLTARAASTFAMIRGIEAGLNVTFNGDAPEPMQLDL